MVPLCADTTILNGLTYSELKTNISDVIKKITKDEAEKIIFMNFQNTFLIK